MAGISVIMPTYNTPLPMLREAVESILVQTFHDFEFIIVDDGSTNGTSEYLNSLTDPRIRIIRNEHNLGITKSLNIGFQTAQGDYIARMDSDDVSLPTRLEKQYAFMESHPDAIACGANGGKNSPALDMERYRIRALFANPGPLHPTAFFDREKLLRFGIRYDEKLVFAQDYGLWVEIARHGNVYYMGEQLLLHRRHAEQISEKHREEQIRCDKMTQEKQLCQLLGTVTEEELALHYRYSTGYFPDAKISPEVSAWYRRLIEANDRVGIYNRRKLRVEIWKIMDRIVENSFEKSMSKYEKTALLFRYLPFPTAINRTAAIAAGIMKKTLRKPFKS